MSIPEFHLTILGSGSAIPLPDRCPPAQIVQYGTRTILVDCGEGTQMRLRECGFKLLQIDLILISHLHGDHVFGLPGLLSSMNHLGRSKPLTVLGPPGLLRLLETIGELAGIVYRFPLDVREIRAPMPAVVERLDDLDILTFPLDHRIPAFGYLLRERPARIRFDKAEIRRRGLSDAGIAAMATRLAKGIPSDDPDLGILYRPLGHAAYAYCSDTRYDRRIAGWLKGTPVIYHETTFLDELAGLALETGHTTAAQAGRLAAEAQAGWLITGHYSSRYKEPEEIVREAMLYFPRVVAGIDGARFNLRALAENR